MDWMVLGLGCGQGPLTAHEAAVSYLGPACRCRVLELAVEGKWMVDGGV